MTNTNKTYQIAAFYHFQSLPESELKTLAQELEKMGEDHGLRGLIILATEGINGTISGETQAAVNKYLTVAFQRLGFPEVPRKWSEAPDLPFRKFRIRLREEIVTLGKPEVQPLPPGSNTHLSPDEWDQMMEKDDVLVLDTRNWYETRIGKFKNALDPQIDEFREFSEYLVKAGIPKEKKILIYCTGGIRCEKATVEMNNLGFQRVYQLDGGILNYLAQKPNKNFEGECFVFDQRVAVDQALKPTKIFKMCPHCGQPADEVIQCMRCDSEAVVCVTCRHAEASLQTCSKNCAHHYARSPGKKGRSQEQGYRFLAVKQKRRPKVSAKNG